MTADASHELRTPLSVIEAQTSLALERERDTGWYRNAFQAVGVESKRMRRLVDDLLWLARFDSAGQAPSSEATDLGVLAQQAAERFTAVAEARGLTMRVAVEPVSTMISAPPEWLDRLLGVLLDNACRYTPPGGTVDVLVGRRDGRVRVAIDDSGPGIPEAERKHIFDRFRRASDAPGGSGLGLAIAAAVVGASGGRWDVGTSPAGGASMAVSWTPLIRGGAETEECSRLGTRPARPVRWRPRRRLSPPDRPSSEQLLDAQRHRARHVLGERFDAGGADPVDTAEATQKRPLAHRSESRDGVKARAERAAGAPCPVVGDREAVRLVTHSLHQEERGTVPLDDDRAGRPGREQLLIALGQSEHRHLPEARRTQHTMGGGELALAAVDEDEVGKDAEAVLAAAARLGAAATSARVTSPLVPAGSSTGMSSASAPSARLRKRRANRRRSVSSMEAKSSLPSTVRMPKWR